MKSFEVSNIKVAHDGGRAEPSQGGSRHPYFLFSGKVSLKFLEKRDIRVFTENGRKTLDGYTLFEFRLNGIASLPSGLSESFTYATEADGNGFTVKPASTDDDGNVVMTSIKRLYAPIGHDYPYPTVHPWGKGHEKCRYDHNRPLSEADIHVWLLPGWGTDWTRERGGFQYRHADRVRA
jgi:hypothetical protein